MNTQKAIAEFLCGCGDDQGPIFRARTQPTRWLVEMHAYAMRVGIKHNVDPRVLVAAYDEKRTVHPMAADVFSSL